MRTLVFFFGLSAGLALWAGTGMAATGPAPDGAALYAAQCAMCHAKPPNDTIPKEATLRGMLPNEIVTALKDGAMRVQGEALKPGEQVAIAEYLTGKKVTAGVKLPASAMCAQSGPLQPAPSDETWNGWGRTPANTRYQPETGGLSAADIPHLKLKWAYGLSGATQARAQPAVYGGRLFFGSQTGAIYAIDAKSGCTHWVFQAAAGVRTAINVGPVSVKGSSGTAIYFTDARTNVYAVDARTGKELWRVNVEQHPAGTGTGAPTLYNGRLYVPVTGVSEENVGGRPDYECCRFRGSITALDANTGKQIWKTYTVPPPQRRGTSSAGKPLWGPAGVGVWSAPTIDAKRGLLYAGTGNAYAGPPQKTSNAVIALDLATGAMKWSNQVLPKDIWIFGCTPQTGGGKDGAKNPNCPGQVGPDFDISASPALIHTAGGKDVLLVTQKSGMGYALDPDNQGKTLWRYRWGMGSGIGGVWGLASDGARAFFSVADQGSAEAGGLHAVDVMTGQRLWVSPPQPTLCKPGRGCSPVQSAAVTLIPGAVFSGGQDGGLRAYSAETGKIIWTYDTNRSFKTVNGVTANGGSIDGPGPVVAGGMLYVTSGNGGFVGRPGNVLLAFEVVK